MSANNPVEYSETTGMAVKVCKVAGLDTRNIEAEGDPHDPFIGIDGRGRWGWISAADYDRRRSEESWEDSEYFEGFTEVPLKTKFRGARLLQWEEEAHLGRPRLADASFELAANYQDGWGYKGPIIGIKINGELVTPWVYRTEETFRDISEALEALRRIQALHGDDTAKSVIVTVVDIHHRKPREQAAELARAIRDTVLAIAGTIGLV